MNKFSQCKFCGLGQQVYTMNMYCSPSLVVNCRENVLTETSLLTPLSNDAANTIIRGVWTADADIRGPGSADFLADADGPRIRQTNTFADADHPRI